MQIKSVLNNIISDALNSLNIEANNPTVSEATKPEFGDFQYNGAMALAKIAKTNPREIAQKIVSCIENNEIFSKVEIAGPGFINLTLNSKFLEESLPNTLNNRCGVQQSKEPIKVVVDYSGPNMAKQMHVGHLRSTIIGDTIANLFEFLGDNVIRQNHIGDWGTQFGMLVAYFEEMGADANMKLSDLEQFYKESKERFDQSEEFANKSRQNVVKLQGGDEATLKLWSTFIEKSLQHCQDVYDSLNVKLNDSCVKGESSYNEYLADIVKDLEAKGIAQESQGAKCIFNDDSQNPLIIQKADGGYLYATTDLAAIKFRVQELNAQRVCYVVDARQGEHFKQVFSAAKEANYAKEDTLLEHIAFGMMLDKSGRPFKTRDGGTVKLKDLIDESIQRAKSVINRANEYTDEELEKIAKVVGIGSLKYADLSINRQSNYIFNWDKMLSLEGNTALYMQYAYARINSILTKAGDFNKSATPKFSDELERRLALKILSLEDTLNRAYKEAMPHYITTYLYELATLFMRFYEQNPILKDGVSSEQKESRLLLASATANAIKVSLDILGIEVLERI
jgi:arginyl-tRNA synthetase